MTNLNIYDPTKVRAFVEDLEKRIEFAAFGLAVVERRRDELKAENERLRIALRYWLPDETMIPKGHEVAWNEHVALIPEHRS